MELNQIFKLASLPLKKLAVIAVAQYFLQRPDIERRMKLDLARRIDEWEEEQSFNSPDSYDERKEHVCILVEKEVINFICIQIDSLPIPEKLSQEIKMVLTKMWVKANYWRRHVLKVFKLDELYTEKIYWTSHGEINQLKIVLDFWCKDIKTSDNNLLWQCHDFFFIENSLFCIALIHAENIENETLIETKKYFFQSRPVLPEGVTATSAIIAKWVLHKKGLVGKASEHSLDNLLKESDPMETSEISYEKPTTYLFLNCIKYEFEFGVKYCFNKLSIIEKHILVTEGAEKCIGKLKSFMKRETYEACEWLYKEDSFLAIRIESILKILLFLIDEMTDLEKLKFLSQNFVVTFQALYVVWPYQELCAEILYFIWDRIEVDEEQFLKLVLINGIKIEGISKTYYRSFEVHSLDFHDETLIIEKSFEHLFCITMNVISKEAKEKVLIKDDFENVRKLYEERKYFSLNRIINDIHLAKYREEILIIAVEYLKNYISCRGSFAVTMFFDSMELTEHESKWLKGKLNYINILLISGDIESAYEHLSWLAESNTELDVLKNRTDYKHLNWILDRETKWDALVYRSHEFFYDLIENTEFEKSEESEVLKTRKVDLMTVTLFNKSIALADKYFKWITDSDTEEIELKNRIDVVEICELMIKNNDFDKADEFLSWMLDTEEERKNIKKTLKCDEFIWNHILDIWSHSGDRFSLCTRLLIWHFDTEEEILNFKASVFKTRNFMEVVLTYWFWCNWDSLNDFDNFLKFWSFSDDEINRIKMGIASNINSWIESCVIKTNNNVKILIDLFDWVYEENKNEKAIVIKNYMNSPDGISLLVKGFQNSIKSSSPKPFVDFLNDWITKPTNFFKIFMLLDGFQKSLEEVNLSLLESLLRMRESGEIVTPLEYSRLHKFYYDRVTEEKNLDMKVEDE